MQSVHIWSHYNHNVCVLTNTKKLCLISNIKIFRCIYYTNSTRTWYKISAAMTVLEYRFDLKGQMQYTRREPHQIHLSTSHITVDLHLTSINN